MRYASEIDAKKPVTAFGFKGMKSRPFTKRFRSMAAYEAWADSDASGDYAVHQIE